MQTSRITLRTLCLITLLAGNFACTSILSDFEEPTVTVSALRSVPGDGTGLNFEIDLKVVNPNSATLKLRGVAYTIRIEGRELINGVGKDLPVIDAYSEGTITLTASASMFEAFQLLGDLMSKPNRGMLRYEIDTKLDIGTLYPTIRVQDSGEIRL